MKKFLSITLILIAIGLPAPGKCSLRTEKAPAIQVSIRKPEGILKMGDTPAFVGVMGNLGAHTAKGLVAYLTLVSLKPGQEHPVDLEDWSAQRAFRINRLGIGEHCSLTWRMKLIQAGKFGVALTVIDPRAKHPIVSDLVSFEIRTKPPLNSKRILPIAIGEPLVLLIIILGLARRVYVHL